MRGRRRGDDAEITRRTGTGVWITTAFAAVLLAAGLTAPGAAQTSDARSAFVARLAQEADGVWITSNAEYRQSADEAETYGIAYELAPGGMAAVGCLWGEIGGEVVGVYWQFFQAWDPVAGRGMLYQTSPDGTVGMGHFAVDGAAADPDEPPLVQEFHGPDGVALLGHTVTWPDPDTHVTGSLAWVDGRWEARRSYTWHRSRDRGSPC